MSHQKQTVSVRLKQKDLQKIERIAVRLNIKNSDVIRYAIKTTLNDLIALNDEARGYWLLPMIIDQCCELSRHFDLDANQLGKIINSDTEDECVQHNDIELLTLCGLSPEHIQFKFQEVTGISATIEEIPKMLKEYLINKYEKLQKHNKETCKAD